MIERKQSKFEKAINSLKNFLFLKEDKLYQKLLNQLTKRNNDKNGFICYFDNNLDLINIHLSELNNSQEIWNVPTNYHYFIIEGKLFRSILNQLQKRVEYQTKNNLTKTELKELDDELNLIFNSELKSYLDDEIVYFISQINHTIGVLPTITQHFVISSNFLTSNSVKKVILRLNQEDNFAQTNQPELTNETTFKDVQQSSLYSLFEKFNPEFITEKERYLEKYLNGKILDSYYSFNFINSISFDFNTYKIMSEKIQKVKFKKDILRKLNPDYLKFQLLHFLFLKDEVKIMNEMRASGVIQYLVLILQMFLEVKGDTFELIEEYHQQSDFLELFTNKKFDFIGYFQFEQIFSDSDFIKLQECLMIEMMKELKTQFSELFFNIDVDKHFKSTSDINESKFDFQKLLGLILSQTNLKLKICFDDLKSYFTETDSEGEVISYHLRDFTNLHKEFGKRVSFEAKPIDVEALEYYKLGAEKGFIQKDSLGEINLLLPLLK